MLENSYLSQKQKHRLWLTAIVSTIVLAIGTLLESFSLEQSWLNLSVDRVWKNLLITAFYLVTLGLGGVLFVALTYITGAKWQMAFRSIPQAMAKILPIAGLLMLGVLVVKMNDYGWHAHGEAGTFWFKELWLTPTFWIARSVGYIVLWVILAKAIGSASTRENKTRLSALFLAIYAVSFSLASADWIMALDPMWFSTIWGVYNFAGMIEATLAVIVILGIMLRAHGQPLEGVFSDDHLHDLGRLLLGFSCFWMYIWFSQYMLIWYSNIPEETSHFIIRTAGPWGPIVIISIILNWIIPFFVLLPLPAKRSASVMMKVACVVLIGRWVDIYQMVFPSVECAAPVFGIWEIASICLLISLTVLLLSRTLSKTTKVQC